MGIIVTAERLHIILVCAILINIKRVVSLMVEPRFYTAMTEVQFCHDLPIIL
jgi:hypothetical protein